MEVAVKDTHRMEIEAASEGRQTVIYTLSGQPSYMNVIPAFRLEELGPGYGTGLHPAFLVGGVEKSQIFIGTYQAVIKNGEAVSLPGQDPAVNINFDQARAACLAAGPGFHLMTNWEWAAIALWCMKNGYGQLRGNTNWGKSHANSSETGKTVNGHRTLTGSGPDSWRHDGTPYGVADLVGNVWEWVDGLKMMAGRVMMPADNNIHLLEANWPNTGVMVDFHEDEGMQLSDTVTEREWGGTTFAELGLKEGYEPPLALGQALLCPVPGQDLTGTFWADNNEDFEALPLRGGLWFDGSSAGLAALDLDVERSDAYSDVGFRPAFIE